MFRRQSRARAGDADKKEALKDITSFANSAGGHLIVGMEETDGVPVRLTDYPVSILMP
jgi:predicted HTH transcriptional regulator